MNKPSTYVMAVAFVAAYVSTYVTDGWHGVLMGLVTLLVLIAFLTALTFLDRWWDRRRG